MLKRPLIVGCKGGMGQRYAAIFRSLGVEFLGIDRGDKIPSGFDSVLIATPTVTHIDLIDTYSEFNVPILCEKPLSTDLLSALIICDIAESERIELEMVNQYAFAAPMTTEAGLTYYNYFKTGQDGLYWDTISISALANGPIEIDNKSPIWSCTINGHPLTLSEIDGAYIAMIEAWLARKTSHLGIPYIRSAHTKVQRLIEASRHESIDRDSGTLGFNAVTGQGF